MLQGMKNEQHSQRPKLQKVKRTSPVRTELIPPEKYFNAWLFIVPFLSSVIHSPSTNYETDISGDLSHPEILTCTVEVQPHGSANMLEIPPGKLHCTA